MTVLADLNLGAQELADQVTAGSADDFVSPATWSKWTNQSILELFKLLVVAQPDLFLEEADFTIAENGSIPKPVGFVSIVGLTKDPDTPTAREIPRFNFRARDSQGRTSYRRMGENVLLRPGRLAAGNYRLYFIARPAALALAPDPDVIVRAASFEDLAVANPDAVWHPRQGEANVMHVDDGGGSGDAILVDGVTIGDGGISGDTILIRHGAAAIVPTYTVRAVATDPLPGTVSYSPGPVFGTLLSRGSGDPGYSVLSIDSVTLDVADLVLIAGQTSAVQNGLYRVAGNDLGSWVLVRVDLGSPAANTIAEYNAEFAIEAARVAVVDGGLYFGTTWRLTSGVGVDVAPLTFELGIIPGKGLWLCGGTGEDGHLYFTRMTEAEDGASIARGFIVESEEGTENEGAQFSSDGDNDTIGGWLVGTSDVTFDEVTTTDVLPSVFEDHVEWIEVRTAIRGLGKEESSEAATELKDRLKGLTASALAFAAAADVADGNCAVDLDDVGGNPFPWGDGW